MWKSIESGKREELCLENTPLLSSQRQGQPSDRDLRVDVERAVWQSPLTHGVGRAEKAGAQKDQHSGHSDS